MIKASRELSYAVRARVLLKYSGQFLMIFGGLALFPLGVSLGFRETALSLPYAAIAGGTMALGFFFNKVQGPSKVQTNEALVLVALFFLVSPFLMTLPMTASGLTFIDALFEAVSGITTTGLSTLATVENMPKTFLFARAWMQWYGGLGIMVFSLALIIPPGVAAKSLGVTREETEDLVGGTKFLARKVLLVYTILTLIGWMGLLLVGVKPFTALLYILASVSTGGFSPQDQGLGGLENGFAQWWILLFCLLCAIPLMFYYQWVRKKSPVILNMLQFRTLLYLSMLWVGLLLFIQYVQGHYSNFSIFHHFPLLALSAQTTAGFSTLPLENLDHASKLVLMMAMFIGGGLGSTAGGIKVLRLLMILSFFHWFLLKTSQPKHAFSKPRLQNRVLEDEEIKHALLIVSLFLFAVIFSWVPFLILGYDPLNSLFEVISAMGTVGLSTGITQSSLPHFLKGVLCVDMLMGRLEILAWLVFIFPKTWVGKRLFSEVS